MDEQLIPYLQEKHPGAFEGWDGFEVSVQTRNRKGQSPVMLVTLFNDGSAEGLVVDIHTAFLLSSNDDDTDNIRVGRELVAEYNDVYIPDQYREENLK